MGNLTRVLLPVRRIVNPLTCADRRLRRLAAPVGRLTAAALPLVQWRRSFHREKTIMLHCLQVKACRRSGKQLGIFFCSWNAPMSAHADSLFQTAIDGLAVPGIMVGHRLISPGDECARSEE